jgi:hypothetical protein
MPQVYSLPTSVYYYIREFFLAGLYFTPEDLLAWRNFLNCNKLHFKDIKRETVYYNLTFDKSHEYLGVSTENPKLSKWNIPLDSLIFVNRIRELILQPSLQLGIIISPNVISLPSKFHTIRVYDSSFVNIACLDDKAFHVCLISSLSISNVSSLRNIRSLNLSNNSKIKDVSCLQNVCELDLSWCVNISNVSSLRRCHTLLLRGCKKMKDVSVLGNVSKLCLAYCTRLKDISMLNNVEDLDLEGCHQITDLRGLTTVTVLNIIKLDKIKFFLPKENTVIKKLFFSSDMMVSMMTFLSMRTDYNAMTKQLKFICYDRASRFLSSMSRDSRESGGGAAAAGNMNAIPLNDNENQPPVTGQNELLVSSLTAGPVSFEKSLEYFQSCQKLEFHSLPIPAVSKFSELKYLTLTCCSSLTTIASLPTLTYLRLYSVYDLQTIAMDTLPVLKELSIRDCPQIQELLLNQQLQKNESETTSLEKVVISLCNRFRTVTVQQKMKMIEIIDCLNFQTAVLIIGNTVNELVCNRKYSLIVK